MLLVQLRKTLCPSAYVEISRPLFRDPRCPSEMIYEGEAQHMPIMYDERRIEKIGSGVNRFDNPAILIKLEY